MAWPLSQDYNEAIQDPVSCFSDAELKQGEAVTKATGRWKPTQELGFPACRKMRE